MVTLLARLNASRIPALLLGTVLAFGAQAHSHDGPGEHVASFQKHLDDYAEDVAVLSDTLDDIAEDYAEGGAGAVDLKAFIAQWEKVEYHEAVETVTLPLYPPIWASISQLRQAIDSGAEAATVRQRTEGVEAALNEGMGALRLAAHQRKQGGDAGPAPAHDDDGHAGTGGDEIERIVGMLENALTHYRDGETEQAKALVQNAYLNRFEGLEGDLIEQDPELVASLEEAFNGELPNAMDSGAKAAKVAAIVERMTDKLRRAGKLLAEADEDKADVF